MMDTVLNLGLNEETLKGLARLTSNERFAYDAYRRFIQMFGKIVLGIDGELFDHAFDAAKRKARAEARHRPHRRRPEARYAKNSRRSSASTPARTFPPTLIASLKKRCKRSFPLVERRPRAALIVRCEKIPDDLGTAVNVVTMVFGNMGNDSGTGVAFTRNPATGEKELFGDYLTNAQGEDVVAGIRTPKHIDQLKEDMPEVYNQFVEVAEQTRTPLQRHAGPRVHNRARQAVDASNAKRQAHRPGCREDRRRYGARRIDRRSAPPCCACPPATSISCFTR